MYVVLRSVVLRRDVSWRGVLRRVVPCCEVLWGEVRRRDGNLFFEKRRHVPDF